MLPKSTSQTGCAGFSHFPFLLLRPAIPHRTPKSLQKRIMGWGGGRNSGRRNLLRFTCAHENVFLFPLPTIYSILYENRRNEDNLLPSVALVLNLFFNHGHEQQLSTHNWFGEKRGHSKGHNHKVCIRKTMDTQMYAIICEEYKNMDFASQPLVGKWLFMRAHLATKALALSSRMTM